MFSFIFTTTVGILCLMSLLFSPGTGEILALYENGAISKGGRTIYQLLRGIVFIGIGTVCGVEFYQKTVWWVVGIIALYWVLGFVLGVLLHLVFMPMAEIYRRILGEPNTKEGRLEGAKTELIIRTIISLVLLDVSLGLYFSSL